MTEESSSKNHPEHVTLFASCMVDQLAPNVGESAVSVLEHLGVRVEFIDDQTCCGQPAFNSGFRSEALPVARRFIELFEKVEGVIVVPSGSCAAMIRNYYSVLFRDSPALVDRAKEVGSRLFEFTEFIGRFFCTDSIGGRLNRKVTYHQSCHLLRELNIDETPLELIDQVACLQRFPLERADVCCGFGGSFSVKMPDISSAILDEKLDNVEGTGANLVIAADVGCVFQIEGGLRRRGSSIQVVHIAELLAKSIQNEQVSG